MYEDTALSYATIINVWHIKASRLRYAATQRMSGDD